jgi:hypothetical protein
MVASGADAILRIPNVKIIGNFCLQISVVLSEVLYQGLGACA